jgi:hypothetical protein
MENVLMKVDEVFVTTVELRLTLHHLYQQSTRQCLLSPSQNNEKK